MINLRNPITYVTLPAILALLVAGCAGVPGATPLPPVVPASVATSPALAPSPTAAPSPTLPATPTPVPTPSPVPTLPPTPLPPTVEAVPEPAPGAAIEAPGLIVYTWGMLEGVELFVAPAGGADPVQLTSSPYIETRAMWSPDATRIAYVSDDPTNDGSDLWVLDPAAPGTARPVTTHGMVGFDTFSWAPDGQAIVYAAPQADGAEMDVYRLEIDTGEVMTLTADWKGWDSSPAWSPDGTQIAFVSDKGEDGKSLDDIWVMGPDGSGQTNLTDNGEAWEDVRPAWSPDGTRLAFFRWSLVAEGDAAGGPAGLWVMNADGSDQRLLHAYQGFMFADAPVWSPDGRLIAFPMVEGGEFNVWVIPAEGGEAIQVSDLAGDETWISWSPDSTTLTFMNETETGVAQYVAAADGSHSGPLLPDEVTGHGMWSPVAAPVDAGIEEPASQCDADEVLAELRALVPYQEFELGYTNVSGATSLTLWFVDPGLATPASGAAIAENVEQARQAAVALSHELGRADPCVAQVFPYINPAVVDSNYDGWFSGLIPAYAMPQTSELSPEQAAAIVQRIGSEYLRTEDTQEPEPAPEGTLSWAEVRPLIHSHFPQDANVAFLLIGNPDGVTVSATWPGPSDPTDPIDMGLNLTALGNVILELQRLHPMPDRLVSLVVDDGGRVHLVSVLEQEDILKGLEALETIPFQPVQ